jgi:hypothetical protein
MQYILFMMFLITPPGQSIPKDKRIFLLQSTQSVEFDSSDACIVARDSIADSVAITDTILLVSSCLPKGQANKTAAPDAARVPSARAAPSAAEKSRERQPDENGIIQFKTMPR